MWPFTSAKPDGGSSSAVPEFSAGAQVSPDQVSQLAGAGYKTILCARPDNEEAGQPTFAAIETAARRAGIRAVYVPVTGAVTRDAAANLARFLKESPGPVYGYCRSGARARALYAAAQPARAS